VFPGVHTAGLGHEQAPHAQLELQYSTPYGLLLHGMLALGEHTPWLLQLPPCQEPVGLHVNVSVPQLPQPTVIVSPGPHVPWHTPPTHVWFEHGEATFHVPVMPHVSGELLVVHCCAPGEHTPLHWPLTHAWFAHATGFPYVPFAPHDSTWMSSWQVVCPGAQEPAH